MIDYERLDKEFNEHCEREPIVDDEIEEVLPLFAKADHISMRDDVLENCTTQFQIVFKKAPLSVLKRLFMKCVAHSPMTAGTLRVLRLTHKAVDLRLGEFSAYVGLFRWLAKQPEVDLSQEATYQSFCNLVSNITKCYDDGVQKVELEVCKATELIGSFVLPLVFDDSDHVRLIALEIMSRVFTMGSMGKRARIAWTNDERPESVNPGLLAFLFLCILQSDYTKGNLKYRSQLLTALECLGDRLKADAYRIPEKYTTIIRTKLSKCEWMVTFAFVKWFKEVLSVSLRPEVPVGMIRVLGREAVDKFFVLNKPNISTNDEIVDSMVALFDLSYFHPPLARQLLHTEKELHIDYYTPELGMRIAKAFVVSTEKFLHDCCGVDSLRYVLEPYDWVISLIDPPRDYRGMYDGPMNSIVHYALRSLESFMIILDAACDSIADSHAVKSPKTKATLFKFAVEFLQIHIRDNMTEVENLALQISPPPPFAEWATAKMTAWTVFHAVGNHLQRIRSLRDIDPYGSEAFGKMLALLTNSMKELGDLISKTEKARENAAREREESRKYRTFYGYAQPRQNDKGRKKF
ncbi:hypothetical protein QR680_018161 [Steinernema hermaphroditum]|uniref:Edg1 TPR repeats region domain-containing protein n=1 Tax=Steinernema hermaphroditum TaxID=289476 RepID=A0AA39HH21_9BILA|nr:hypothetical protein QR680_018161 [Steinernema hermaphroditum]